MNHLLVHTASLYYWFDDYAATLDDRISAILDAGADGVEISNGATIISWEPSKEILDRLRDKVIALHAEVGAGFGVSPADLIDVIKRLPNVSHVVFHPDELTSDELKTLPYLPFKSTLENMDSRNRDWQQVARLNIPGIGLTFDTSHAMETGAQLGSVVPQEIHLSLSNEGDYYTTWGYTTHQAMTTLDPDKFPYVPSASPIVTIEGLIPPDVQLLKNEIEFVRSKLC